jgi:hypothetical protein
VATGTTTGASTCRRSMRGTIPTHTQLDHARSSRAAPVPQPHRAFSHGHSASDR